MRKVPVSSVMAAKLTWDAALEIDTSARRIGRFVRSLTTTPESPDVPATLCGVVTSRAGVCARRGREEEAGQDQATQGGNHLTCLVSTSWLFFSPSASATCVASGAIF